MLMLDLGGQSRDPKLVKFLKAQARRQPKVDCPQGRRNRRSLP